MKKGIVILTVLGMLIGVAGCGDGSANSQAAEANLIDPCELISRADAQQWMGEALKDAEKRENRPVGQKFCLYNAESDDSFAMFQISITQQAFMPSGGQSPASIYNTLKDNFPDAVRVDGIGDDAFIAPPGLHLLSGDYYITIAVGNSDDPGNRRILKEAGQKAVQTLERLRHK